MKFNEWSHMGHSAGTLCVYFLVSGGDPGMKGRDLVRSDGNQLWFGLTC